jgi:hypothetical protein
MKSESNNVIKHFKYSFKKFNHRTGLFMNAIKCEDPKKWESQAYILAA